MPIKGNVRYAMKKTPKGMIRLAFKDSEVVEAKNMKTGAKHTMSEFAEDKKMMAKRKAKKAMMKG